MKRVLALLMVLCFGFSGCGVVGQSSEYIEEAVTDSRAYTKKALEKSIKNEPSEDDYTALADLYLEKNDKKSAMETLNAGIKKLGRTEKLGSAIEKLPKVIYDDSYLQSVYKYDENGFLLEEVTHNVGRYYVDSFKYQYDENGNMIKKTEYNGYLDEVINKCEYQYNEDGNVTEKLYYSSPDTKIPEKTVYEYDENGNMVKIISSSNDTTLYEYDENGLLIKEICYNNHGEIETIYKYKYDEYENLTEKAYYYRNEDDDPNLTKYKYDKYGNLIEDVEYISKDSYGYDPDNPYNYKHNYLCDENGNILQEMSGDILFREHNYDENGNRSKTIYYYEDQDGNKFQDTYEYEYDEMGNKIREKINSQYSGSSHEWKYEYDEKGNFVCATKYSGYSGKVEYELKA